MEDKAWKLRKTSLKSSGKTEEVFAPIKLISAQNITIYNFNEGMFVKMFDLAVMANFTYCCNITV